MGLQFANKFRIHARLQICSANVTTHGTILFSSKKNMGIFLEGVLVGLTLVTSLLRLT